MHEVSWDFINNLYASGVHLTSVLLTWGGGSLCVYSGSHLKYRNPASAQTDVLLTTNDMKRLVCFIILIDKIQPGLLFYLFLFIVLQYYFVLLWSTCLPNSISVLFLLEVSADSLISGVKAFSASSRFPLPHTNNILSFSFLVLFSLLERCYVLQPHFDFFFLYNF